MATRRLQKLSMTTLLVLLALPAWAAVESSTPAALNTNTAEQVEPTQALDTAPVDPADDPWLSEEGPPVPIPDEIAEEQVADTGGPRCGPPPSPTRVGLG